MKTKINFIKSTLPNAKERPVVVFIPGGPALSSKTLSGLEVLNRSFDLAFIDLPGTGGQRDPEVQTFESVLMSIENSLTDMNRKIILAGHSFGGYMAAKVLERGKIKAEGFICMAAPFLQESYDGLVKEYEKYMTPKLKIAAQAWGENKTLQNMKNWFSEYGILYFSEENLEKGRALILNDEMSLSLFLGLRTAVEKQLELLSFIKSLSIPKIFIAGEKDHLIPPELLKQDAEAGEFDFYILKNAAHFMNLDKPEEIARLIENKFVGSEKGKR